MTMNQNDPEQIIDDPEDFIQYRIWLLSGHKGKTLNPTTIKVANAQLYGESNSHVFTNIKLFSYIRHVQCNVHIIFCSKDPEKGFGLVIIEIPKKNIIIPLWPSYYMTQNPQNTISQPTLKHYNELRNVITEAIRWVHITADKGVKFKVKTSAKERYQQLFYFVSIDILNIEQKHTSSKDIINISINPIINISFNKDLM